MDFLKKFFWLIFYPLRILPFLILGFIIPFRGKRLLFMTSLYLYLSGTKELNKPVLLRLNRALNLAKDTDALLLPAYFHQLVWNERLEEALDTISPKEKVERGDPVQLNNLCKTIISATPKWLQYGRYDDMVKDTICIFENARVHCTGEIQTA